MGTSLLTAFLVGGLICVVGQLLLDLTKLTSAHVMVLFVVLGAILSGLGLYEPLVKFGGAGATVPVSGFGHALTSGVMEGIQRAGFLGLFTGIFNTVSAGLAAAIIFGLIMSLLFNPKS